MLGVGNTELAILFLPLDNDFPAFNLFSTLVGSNASSRNRGTRILNAAAASQDPPFDRLAVAPDDWDFWCWVFQSNSNSNDARLVSAIDQL